MARLATVGADRAPHIVPVTFAITGGTIVTAVDGKPKKGTTLRRVENVAANPLVSLLVDAYHADWTRLWWARADGRASIAADGADLEGALAALRARYPQYESIGLIGPAIVIEVDRWSGWSAS